MNDMKKIVIACLTIVLVACLIPKSLSANNSKEIDIYLIAGQSNAAGTTKYKAEDLRKIDSRYVDGFENIYYAGAAGGPSGQNMNLNEVPLQPVKAGFGYQAGIHIGAEIGIADELSKYYNSETGKYAGIIKYGLGGTALLNDLGGANEAGGNWVPPSYQKTLKEGVTEKTGGLYRLFLAEVEKQLESYRDAGFKPVVKGMFWMQGEADRGNQAEYKIAFEYFASDVRKDLTKITGQDLKHMPIHVGLISRTFNSAEYAKVNVNKAFIKMQRSLADSITHCFIVETDEFDLNDAYGALGSDNNHWNYKDMIVIGKMVGKGFVECKHLYNQEIADTKHLKTAGTCSTNSVYYKACLCGAISGGETFELPSQIKHQYGPYKTIVEATATKEGTKQRTCTVCNSVDVVKISKKTQSTGDTHTHVFDREVIDSKYLKTEGDCSQESIYWKSCKCGEKSTSDSDTFGVMEKEHTFEDFVVTKEATEEQPGVKERICKVCRFVETAEIEVLKPTEQPLTNTAHTMNWWIIVGIAVVGTVGLGGLIIFLIYKKRVSKTKEM